MLIKIMFRYTMFALCVTIFAEQSFAKETKEDCDHNCNFQVSVFKKALYTFFGEYKGPAELHMKAPLYLVYLGGIQNSLETGVPELLVRELPNGTKFIASCQNSKCSSKFAFTLNQNSEINAAAFMVRHKPPLQRQNLSSSPEYVAYVFRDPLKYGIDDDSSIIAWIQQSGKYQRTQSVREIVYLMPHID